MGACLLWMVIFYGVSAAVVLFLQTKEDAEKIDDLGEQLEFFTDLSKEVAGVSDEAERDLLMAKERIRAGDVKTGLARLDHALWRLRDARCQLENGVS